MKIAKSGKLTGEAIFIDLKDHERALVWIDRRFARVLDTGIYALWTIERDVRVEIVDARPLQIVHPELQTIVRAAGSSALLEVAQVEPGQAAVWFRNGTYQATLEAGTYAFWKGAGKLKVHVLDLKEQVLDINGQDIMTNNKGTPRLKALVAYRITKPLRAGTEVERAGQAPYRP